MVFGTSKSRIQRTNSRATGEYSSFGKWSGVGLRANFITRDGVIQNQYISSKNIGKLVDKHGLEFLVLNSSFLLSAEGGSSPPFCGGYNVKD